VGFVLILAVPHVGLPRFRYEAPAMPLSVWPMSRREAVWRRDIRWLTVGIAAVALALAVAWVLFVPAADWLARHDVGSAHGALLQTARDDARGRLLTLGAGLLAASALLFTARNFILSREGQVTDRYTKAIEQLGSDKLDVRLGGIYALERVARDSARDHPTVMEVLTAFIREHSRDPRPPSDPGGDQRRSPRPDVQAAITVIGRRNAKRDIRPIDLTCVVLARANLTNAYLARANLTYASFVGSDLTYADFTGADLTDADFTRANLFRGSRPCGPHWRGLPPRGPRRRVLRRRVLRRRGPHRRGPHRRGPHRRVATRREHEQRGPRRREPH
jgi:Pentapeptide repeats (8 copies)